MRSVGTQDAYPLATATSPSWPAEKWIPALESLRGIAAAVVVAHHIFLQFTPDSTGFVASILRWFGAWGVMLFFVLSGFCIHLPASRKNPDAPWTVADWKSFFSRRARRLLPAYYLALAASTLLATQLTSGLINAPTSRSIASHILLVHVWTGDFYGINQVFWSIGVEVHFYLFYPVYLALRRAVGSGRVILVLIPVALAVYFVGSVAFHGDARLAVQKLFITYWWQWALGAWLADIYSNPIRVKSARIVSVLRKPVVPLLALVASLALGCVDPVIARLHLSPWLLPPFLGLLVLSVVVQRSPIRFKALEKVGKISYSLYLLHPLAICLAARLICGSLAVAALTCAVGSLGLAAVGYRFAERPWLGRSTGSSAPQPNI